MSDEDLSLKFNNSYTLNLPSMDYYNYIGGTQACTQHL